MVDNNNNDISLKEMFLKFESGYKFILSKWIIICICGLFGAGLGYYYASKKATIFIATSTFVLQESEGGAGALGQYAGLASMVGLGGGGSGEGIFSGDNLLELYKSRNMIQKALLGMVKYNGREIRLVDLFIDINDYKRSWSNNNQLKDITFQTSKNGFTRLQDSLLSDFVGDINTNYLSVKKLDEVSNIIKVEVKSKNENFSKLFNDQIVKTVNDFYVQTKTKKSQENVNVLQIQTDSVRNVLNGAIYSSAAVIDETPNLNPTRQILRTVPTQRSQFNAESNKAILVQLVQNLELSKLALRKETPLIQVIDTPIFPLAKNKLGKIKGLVVGGIAFGFLAVIILIIRETFRIILK